MQNPFTYETKYTKTEAGGDEPANTEMNGTSTKGDSLSEVGFPQVHDEAAKTRIADATSSSGITLHRPTTTSLQRVDEKIERLDLRHVKLLGKRIARLETQESLLGSTIEATKDISNICIPYHPPVRSTSGFSIAK